MIRKIYHGSSKVIQTPRFGAGDPGNDFGLGFYCAEDPSIASEWAVGRDRNGFVNRYTIETTGLRIIDLCNREYCILHWLSILLNYRQFDTTSSLIYQAEEYIRTAFGIDYQNCDIIVGYRADNSNFSFAQSFLGGGVSYRVFRSSVLQNDTGKQFVLKSNRAFDRLVFDGYDIVHGSDFHPKKTARDRAAVENFAITASRESLKDDINIYTIPMEKVRPYDERLR